MRAQEGEPEHCTECGSVSIEFVSNEVVYGGAAHGEWPFIWRCNDCYCYVSCHANTRNPLGRFADKKTRKLRVQAHAAFDPLWRNGPMPRTKAYAWLARMLGIDDSACHISHLSDDHLRKTIEIAPPYIAAYSDNLNKRNEKRAVKQRQRNEREHRKEVRHRNNR